MLQKNNKKGQVWNEDMVSKSSGHSHESHATIFFIFIFELMNCNHYTGEGCGSPLIALDWDRNEKNKGAEKNKTKNKVYISINTNCAVYSFETDHEILLIDLSQYRHFFILLFTYSFFFCISLLWYGAAKFPSDEVVRAALSLLPDRQPPCWKTTETSLLTCWVRRFKRASIHQGEPAFYGFLKNKTKKEIGFWSKIFNRIQL